MDKLGNPLEEDFLDVNLNTYGLFSPAQEPGFVNRSVAKDMGTINIVNIM